MKSITRKLEALLNISRFKRASDVVRARALYVIGIVFIGMQIVNLIVMTLIYGGWTIDHTLILGAIGIFLALIYSIKKTNSFSFQSGVIIVLTLTGIFASAASDGTGINSAALPIIPVAIIISGLISGWRMTLISGAAAVCLIAVLYRISMGLPAGHQFDPAVFAERNQARALQASIICVMTTLIMSLFSWVMHGLFKRLEDSIAKIRKDEKSKTEFLSNMSREIRVPLSGVHGMSTLLLRTELDSQQHQYASIIQNCSQSLVDLVEQVLDFSKIDTAALDIQAQPFEIRKLAKSLVYLHFPATAKKRLKLRLQVNKKTPEFLKGDEGRIRQVVNTLLNNAILHTHHGEVILSINGRESSSGYILKIGVQDTGVGIPEDKIKALFERFKYLGTDGSEKIDVGSQGLPMAKALVKAMGGTLDVNSIVNQGSRFTVSIPVALPDRAQPDPGPSPAIQAA